MSNFFDGPELAKEIGKPDDKPVLELVNPDELPLEIAQRFDNCVTAQCFLHEFRETREAAAGIISESKKAHGDFEDEKK